MIHYNEYILKSTLMHVSSSDRGCFMKNFRFDSICNISQEQQEVQLWMWIHRQL